MIIRKNTKIGSIVRKWHPLKIVYCLERERYQKEEELHWNQAYDTTEDDELDVVTITNKEYDTIISNLEYLSGMANNFRDLYTSWHKTHPIGCVFFNNCKHRSIYM